MTVNTTKAVVVNMDSLNTILLNLLIATGTTNEN